MIRTEFEVKGVDSLLRKLDRLKGGIEDKSPLLEQAGVVLIESSQRNFEEGGRPRWEPLTETTLLLRAQSKAGYREHKRGENKGRLTAKTFNTYISGAKTLRDSGMLMGSVGNPSVEGGVYRITKNSIAIGTALKYAAPTQDGVKETKGLIVGKQIPARAFIGAQQEDKDRIYLLAHEFVRERISEAGF